MSVLLVHGHAPILEALSLLITQAFSQVRLVQADDTQQAQQAIERHPELQWLRVDPSTPHATSSADLVRLRGAAGGALPEPETDSPAGLTPRQRDVLHLLIEGRSNKQMGRELGMSASTVKTHLAAIYQRLGANTRTQAVVAAARLGLRLGASPAG